MLPGGENLIMSVANVLLRVALAIFLVWVVMALVRREEEKKRKK